MNRSTRLADFLSQNLGVDAEVMAIALSRTTAIDPLHLVLWQLGLISIHQVQQVLVWLEDQPLR